ncbi:MAG: ComEC/Rec2 family competence protein, partial [Actinomycetota bacterium]
AGSLGTSASLSAASCEIGSFQGELGTVILDGAPGEPGSPFRATGYFLPFGSDGFSAGRRRTGALAEFDATQMEVGDPAGLDRLAATVRASARRSVEGLEPRAGALSLGLVIGDTSGFDVGTEGSFRRAGLSHLVAVSGSNVAIVLGAVLILGSRLSVPLRLSLAGAALGIFVLVVGPEPSVLRAAAMGVVALLALLLGRRSEPLQALCLATMVLSALRPTLVFSLGFWLSVAATLGIILWASAASRSLERIIGSGRKRAWLGAAFGVTCAAQFAVAPILALVFGTLSVTGPLANLLAVPAVPLATILGFLAAVTGTIAAPLADVCAFLSAPFLGWILWVADHLGRSDWSDAAVSPHAGWALMVLVTVAGVTTLCVRRT